MKLTNRLIILALAAAAGAVTLSTKLVAADSAQPTSAGCGMGMGCCGGMTATTPVAATNTNAIPDLLTTCPVSGEKLGEMGKPFTFVYKDQEVKLCCKSCKKKFDADPEKYMAIIRAADKK